MKKGLMGTMADAQTSLSLVIIRYSALPSCVLSPGVEYFYSGGKKFCLYENISAHLKMKSAPNGEKRHASVSYFV